MATISNLPDDLLEEILCMVPMTYLRAMRSTCKLWNTLLKDPISKPAKEIMFITKYDLRACLMSINLHDHNRDPSIKQIGELKEVKIHKVFHCYVSGIKVLPQGFGYTVHHTSWIRPRSRVWDPYMGPIRYFYGMGYDSNNNYKILRVTDWHTHIDYEIYDLKSSSWRILDISMNLNIHDDGISLKGDNYFLVFERLREASRRSSCIICFDFTRERIWRLSLPHYSKFTYFNALSLVSEDQLAVLSWKRCTSEMEIWITDKIEPITVSSDALSWNRFLKVDYIHINRFFDACGFFVDEKKKVTVIFARTRKAFMVGEGEGGLNREVELDTPSLPMCSIYVPSLMKIQ